MPDRHDHPWQGPPWGGGPPPWGPGRFEAGRRFRRGVLVALLIVVLLVAGLATIVAAVVTGNAPHPWITMLVAAAVVVGLIVSARWVWRSTRSVGALMDAADRVAAGDYSTRVHAPASRQLGRLTGAFNQMAERLETNEQRRRELLADVAHELRTPLQVIRGSIEGMLDGLYPADPDRLRAIVDETLVMARLLEDLRTLSMAQEGVLRLEIETVDPRALAEETVRSFETLADSKDVNVTIDTGSAPAAIDVDPVRIGEVLSNLLSNAIRHTPSGGRVDVELTAVNGDLQLQVSDTGAGIPDDELSLVFDRFVRSADTGGTGLGLPIAKRLVEAHGGTIEALRNEGGGTRMRITIPTRSVTR